MGGVWRAGQKDGETPKTAEQLEHKKTAPISVPIIARGTVAGYVTAQFVYLIDAKKLKEMPVPPDVFVTDEAFRMLYAEQFDFEHLEKYDLPGVAKELAKRVNQRLGENSIKDVLISEFNYVPKRDISK
jgi:hypothetical protein